MNARPRPIGGGVPLVLLAPALVVLVGFAVAFAIGVLGVARLSDEESAHAHDRAFWIATLLGQRLDALQPDARPEAVQLAARRSGAEVLVADEDGTVTDDATLGAPARADLAAMIRAREGEATTAMGRTRFAAHALPSDARTFVVAFVRVPRAPAGAPALVQALVALTTLLLGIATIAAYAVARDARQDIAYVTRRVDAMAVIRTQPSGEQVPVRTIDEVGALTSALNDLTARVAEAERAYRDDLARARAADRDRAEFLAAVSHELRTPLNAVIGFSDVLADGVDGSLPPDACEDVELIRQSGRHLSALVDDILDLSALEGGRLVLQRSRVDLVQLAAGVLREAGGLVPSDRVALTLRGDSRLVAFVDERRVRQILGNLVGNAVKFTGRGEVSVAVRADGESALVEVHDTGPGIPLHEQAAIFDAFKQAKAERGRRRGTGLGLAIVSRLAAMHGGSVELESRDGRGATFRVRLPIGEGP